MELLTKAKESLNTLQFHNDDFKDSWKDKHYNNIESFIIEYEKKLAQLENRVSKLRVREASSMNTGKFTELINTIETIKI